MADGWEEFNVSRTQSAATIADWRRKPGQLKMSRIVGEAYKKDMKAGLLIHRVTNAERNEIDLAESMGPAARLDEAKQQFKALKEKAEHYVTADGKKIGGVPRESGNIFNFLNKLLKHEMARADNNLAKEVLRQKNEQIKDETVKAEWQAVVAASKRPEDTDDLTTFRKKKEKKLADARPATAPIRIPGQPAAEFQAWPGNQWGDVPRGLAAHRSHSAKVREKVGRPKSAALVPGARGFNELELQPAAGRNWASVLKLEFRMNQKKLVVGRSDACDVKLDKHSCTREDLNSISREHCTVIIDDYGIMTIKDHSSNGTLVNDLLLKRGENPDMCPLEVGDSVTFGGHASDCKYVLAINKGRAALSQIDATKLRGQEQVAEGATDSVKLAMILAGDVKLAARESHRAWALWSSAATVIKDISAVKILVTFASSGSPHQCAHAAAALHSLSKDPAGMNLVINAGGVAALSTLAAVNDEFIDGLETCKEEAILGLRSIIMRSAQGRERVAKDGALRLLIKIAGNSDDPMCYLADEAVREFEEIEEREKEERAAKAGAKNSGRPRTANSSVSLVSTDGASDADTDVYTIASSRPSSALLYPKGEGLVGGAKMDYERANAFRPHSAVVNKTPYLRPQSADFLASAVAFEGDRSMQKQLRPSSAATILTQQQYFQEAARRPIMYKKEYVSTDQHEEAVPLRHESATRPGLVHSMTHKTKTYFAFERTAANTPVTPISEQKGFNPNELSATEKYLKDISEYDSHYGLSQEDRAKAKRKFKKDRYMPAVPRGPIEGSSSSDFMAAKEAQDHGQKFLIDGIYRQYMKPGGWPRDIDSLRVLSLSANIFEEEQPENLSAPSLALDQQQEETMQTGEMEKIANPRGLSAEDDPSPEEREAFAKEDVMAPITSRNLKRPGSAHPTGKNYVSIPTSPLVAALRARPASAGGVLSSESLQSSKENTHSICPALGAHAAADVRREQASSSVHKDQAQGLVSVEELRDRPQSSGRFARPTTPGGLMPIFERAESSLNDSRQMDASVERSSSVDVSGEEASMSDRHDKEQMDNGPWSATILSLASIWGQIFDGFSSLGQMVGRFFNETQILNLVQNIHDKAMKEASSHEEASALEKYQRKEFQRFLSANIHQISQAGGIDYFKLTEMIAPDAIGRYALLIYGALKDKTVQGVCVAELQRTLELADLSDEDIVRISGMRKCNYPPSAAEEQGPGRVKFSAMYQNILAMMGHSWSSGNTNSVLSPVHQHDQRQQLERTLQALCELLTDDGPPEVGARDVCSVPSPRKSQFVGERKEGETGATKVDAEDLADVFSDSGDEDEPTDDTVFDAPMRSSELEADVFSRNLPRDWLPRRSGGWRTGSAASSSGSRRPGSAAAFRPQSAASRSSSSSVQEAESPGKQPSPQPYSARLQALAAAVTAKESEAAELRKRMHEMSQEFNAHLTASGSWPVQFSAEAGVVHQIRAQSAPQNARNRLLSRGLPSSTAMPASAAAVASAATTAPHSGATTATPSGVQTPLRAGHDQNYEEELRYKQALVRALEKSYLSEVGKLHREIEQLSCRRDGIGERPATASGIFPHRSTATIGVADESPARVSSNASILPSRDRVAPDMPLAENMTSEDSRNEMAELESSGRGKEGVRERERLALLSDSARKARARAESAGGGGLQGRVSLMYQRPSTATTISQRGSSGDQVPATGGHGLAARPVTAHGRT